MNRSVQKAFTLIEMLVVISIIGILATLVAANLNSARSRARDAQRKSDMKNLQTALRLYYNDFGVYPGASGGGNILGCGSAIPPTSLCRWGEGWSTGSEPNETVYMSILPRDPLSPTQSYRYTFVDSDDYVLSACLENKSDTNAVEELDLDWCPTGKAFKLKP